MDSKTLIQSLKSAVRQVIKEELTEILREGLQSTINEQKKIEKVVEKQTKFSNNKWSDILNQTDSMYDPKPAPMNSFSQLMNENIDGINMTSNDARRFGEMRQNMKQAIGGPTTMEDPETGEIHNVDPAVAKALTRDYSDLMSALNKKKSM